MLKKLNTNTLLVLVMMLLIQASHSLLAQRQDSSYHCSYYLEQGAELKIDISHAELIISPSADDSIRIYNSVSLIPNNVDAPFNGITSSVKQLSDTKVWVNLLISSEIQPHNQLKAFCQISLPQSANIKLNGRYAQIDLASPFGEMQANTEYCTLRAVSLNEEKKHQIKGSYTELYIDNINSALTLEGTNIKLESQYIEYLSSNLKFSNIKAEIVKRFDAISYSDKYIINAIDSAAIKGEYSSLLLGKVNAFFQSDLSYGALIIKTINTSFHEINLAHQYVSTQINYPAATAFSINADMRYCKLISPAIKYKEIASPSGTLYKGNYGNQDLALSKFSIISSFGDVTLTKQ